MAKKIAIFYHVYQYGNWQQIYADQISLLRNNGLLDACDFIYIGVNGSLEIKSFEKSRIVINQQPWSEETPTLLALRNFCLKNKDYKILYLHTKGVTQPMQSTHDWRKIMEYFCIEQWRECIDKLDHYDAVGCLYMDECYYGFFPHFSGNFWWTNSSYIRELDDSYLLRGIRQNREFWIGSGDGSLFSFHTTGLNHYAHEYPREIYAN